MKSLVLCFATCLAILGLVALSLVPVSADHQVATGVMIDPSGVQLAVGLGIDPSGDRLAIGSMIEPSGDRVALGVMIEPSGVAMSVAAA